MHRNSNSLHGRTQIIRLKQPLQGSHKVIVTTVYKQRELIQGLALTSRFYCHWEISLCYILSLCYDLIIHNSFETGSLDCVHDKLSNHLEIFANNMHVAKHRVCIQFDNHRINVRMRIAFQYGISIYPRLNQHWHKHCFFADI